MRKFSLRKFLFLFFATGICLSLPPLFVEKMRVGIVSSFSPLWKGVHGVTSLFETKKSLAEIENGKLKSENHLLKLEIEKLRTLIDTKPFLDEWKGHIIPARVIYRDPASFCSTLWINVGENANRKFGKKIIEKNSPVLFGKSLIGVVEVVGKKESKVRLITDANLKPSVRAWRPSKQNSLSQKGEGWYLAKGSVHGSSSPLWRMGGNRLKGVGFNCDFPEEKKENPLPLIEVGDLLVTTGMDGVFPPNLHVGSVTRVYPLKEGDWGYEIEAVPNCKEMNDLTTVFVIASLRSS